MRYPISGTPVPGVLEWRFLRTGIFTARIRAAIDALSESQKDLIQKIFDEGMSIKDYAAFCGVKPSAISHRIGTIRNNLKEILKKKREFPAIPIMSLTGNFILFITTTAFLS